MPANRIKMLRGIAKLTQADLAQRMGVTLRTVQRWEAGEVQIPDEQKLQLAEVFGFPVAFVMGWAQAELPEEAQEKDENGGNGDSERGAA